MQDIFPKFTFKFTWKKCMMGKWPSTPGEAGRWGTARARRTAAGTWRCCWGRPPSGWSPDNWAGGTVKAEVRVCVWNFTRTHWHTLGWTWPPARMRNLGRANCRNILVTHLVLLWRMQLWYHNIALHRPFNVTLTIRSFMRFLFPKRQLLTETGYLKGQVKGSPCSRVPAGGHWESNPDSFWAGSELCIAPYPSPHTPLTHLLYIVRPCT